MSEQRHAVASGLVTRDETRNSGWDQYAEREAEMAELARRKVMRLSTVRSREYRRRKKLGLMARTVRITPKVVTKLVELGYLRFESRGDAKAEGIAIEAYLGDNL